MRTLFLGLLFLPFQDPTPKPAEPDTLVHRMGDLRWQHGAYVSGMSVLPGDKQALTAGYNGVVLLWNLESGERIRSYSGGHAGEISSLTLIPGTRRFATGGLDGKVVVWELDEPQPKKTIETYQGDPSRAIVRFLQATPDGSRLVAAGDRKPVKVIDLKEGREVRAIAVKDSHYSSGLALDPTSRRALVGLAYEAQLFDLDTGALIRTLTLPRKGKAENPPPMLEEVGWHPDGRSPFGVVVPGGLLTWDPETGAAELKFSAQVYANANAFFTPDGRRFVSGTYGGVELWDCEKKALIRKLRIQNVRHVQLIREGKVALVVQTDGTFLLWDVEKDAKLGGGGTGPVTAVAVSPNGKTIVAGTRDGAIRQWELRDGTPVRSHEMPAAGKYADGSPMPDYATAFAFTPDGRHVVSGHWDARTALWEMATGKLAREWKGCHTSTVCSIALSPDGRYVASTTALCDVTTGAVLKSYDPAVVKTLAYIPVVAFSPDGRHLVRGPDNERIKVLDAMTGERLREFAEPVNMVVSLAFTADGRRVFSGSEMGEPGRLWDFETGKVIRTLPIPQRPGLRMTATFAPDDRWLYAAGEDGRLCLWEVETGKLIRKFEGHASLVTSIALSPGGRFVTTGSTDSTIIHRHPGIGYKAKSIAWADEMKKDGEKLERAWKRYAQMLASDDHEVWLEAMERGVALGDALVSEILNRYSASATPAPAEKMTAILKKLDDEDLETRQAGMKALAELGEPAYGWVRDLLATPALSSNARAGLESVKRDIETRPGKALEVRDRAELNLVLILLEQPDTESKWKGLERFAQGPLNSVAARIARRHIDRR